MATVNLVLPFLPTKPVGGARVMFEYANHLAACGYQVNLLCSIERPYKSARTPVFLRFLLTRFKTIHWFGFHQDVRVRVVPRINNRTTPDAVATISTWWQMAYAITQLSAAKGVAINLIQDYELWKGQAERVHASYSLPVCHVVIARYLQDLVEQHSGSKPIHIPNAIDLQQFTITTPPAARPASVIMLYSEEEHKGSVYGLAALEELKRLFPALEATLFSVYARPRHIPAWIAFVQRPANLSELYNRHTIFMSPSLSEGWALPPAEAMACGCAVVCTDIGGHWDYGIQEKTALLVPARDPGALVMAVSKLLTDPVFRTTLSTAALEHIRQFDWQRSTRQLIQLFQDNR